MSENTSIDELFDDIGGMPNPYANLCPEERMYKELIASNDKYQKIYNCRYWLNCELSVYSTFFEKSLYITKNAGANKVALNWTEIARVLLEHYYLMTAFPRFDKSAATPARPQVDMTKFLDLVMAHDEIKRTIAQYGH